MSIVNMNDLLSTEEEQQMAEERELYRTRDYLAMPEATRKRLRRKIPKPTVKQNPLPFVRLKS